MLTVEMPQFTAVDFVLGMQLQQNMQLP